MALTRLRNEAIQCIVFGGKGGVGKTTMATATALELAKAKRTLLFTTDPAPALTHSFGQAIGSEPTAVVGVPNLFAMEINGRSVVEEFKITYGKDIYELLQKGTYLSRSETLEMYQLDIPGLEELMRLKKITNVLERADYELYIIDTAPTSQTLQLLVLPDMLDHWIRFFAKMRWKHKILIGAFARGKYLEQVDAFLLEMKKTVKKVKALLQNGEKTEFVMVARAEKTLLSETDELLGSLARLSIPSRELLVNYLLPPEAPGSAEQWNRRKSPRSLAAPLFFHAPVHYRQALDFAERRRKTQTRYIEELQETLHSLNITRVPLQPTEIQGIEHLQQLGAYLFTEAEEASA
ncbi:MAG: ArsA family ATPase [Chloroflexota bacterium]|nr:ArsA family ATPase [Chloroflexota bacterium]